MKGNLVLNYVKIIRSSPNLPWGDYLTADDKSKIEQMVLPASWYPMGFFQRAGMAVFKLVGRESLPLARALGKSQADELVADYPAMIGKGRPLETLKRYVQIQHNFYSFEAFDVGFPSEREAVVNIYSKPTDPGTDAYIEQICGCIERLIEMSGYPEAVFELTEESSENKVTHSLSVKW